MITTNYNYGGKGITVCDEWKGKEGFFSFKKWANDNGWVKGLTLDRIDNNLGYCPNNCRWVTFLQQEYNKSTKNIHCYAGYEIPLGMIARIEGVEFSCLNELINSGMGLNEALIKAKAP